MANSTIAVLVAIIVLWLYSIGSIYTGEFKDERQKLFWRIGIIFVPILAFFYLFMKKNLLK